MAKKKETVLSLLGEIRDLLRPVVKEATASFITKSDGRFTTLEDGWVKDSLLGLDWGPSSDKRMTWEEAKKYAASKGGRLPEVEELSRLVDYKKYNPSTNKEFFPDIKTDDWYWTGTESAGLPGCAWVVSFDGGDVGSYHKGSNSYVRPVRPSK